MTVWIISLTWDQRNSWSSRDLSKWSKVILLDWSRPLNNGGPLLHRAQQILLELPWVLTVSVTPIPESDTYTNVVPMGPKGTLGPTEILTPNGAGPSGMLVKIEMDAAPFEKVYPTYSPSFSGPNWDGRTCWTTRQVVEDAKCYDDGRHFQRRRQEAQMSLMGGSVNTWY